MLNLKSVLLVPFVLLLSVSDAALAQTDKSQPIFQKIAFLASAIDTAAEVLRGIKGAKVIIDPLSDDAKLIGLTHDMLKTDIELRLRKAGFNVVAKTKEFYTVKSEDDLHTLLHVADAMPLYQRQLAMTPALPSSQHRST